MPRFPLNVFFWPLAKVHDKSEPCPSLLLLKPFVPSESAKASLACLSEHKSPANVRAHPGGSRDAGALCYVCFCCRLLHSSFPSLRHCGFNTFQFISISILHSLFGLDNFFQRNSHSLNASSGVLPWYLDFHWPTEAAKKRILISQRRWPIWNQKWHELTHGWLQTDSGHQWSTMFLAQNTDLNCTSSRFLATIQAKLFFV